MQTLPIRTRLTVAVLCVVLTVTAAAALSAAALDRCRSDARIVSGLSLDRLVGDAALVSAAAAALALGLLAVLVMGQLAALVLAAPSSRGGRPSAGRVMAARTVAAACRSLTPRAARGLVAACCGVGIAVGVTGPASAVREPAPPNSMSLHASGADPATDPRPDPGPDPGPDPAPAPRPPASLHGLLLPDLPLSAPRPPDGGQIVVVRPGDSLWRIAARLLPADATEAEIDRVCHRIYSANARRIGSDPDLIHPGTRLDVGGVGR